LETKSPAQDSSYDSQAATRLGYLVRVEKNVESPLVVTRSAQMRVNERDGNFLDEEETDGYARTTATRSVLERERNNYRIAACVHRSAAIHNDCKTDSKTENVAERSMTAGAKVPRVAKSDSELDFFIFIKRTAGARDKRNY